MITRLKDWYVYGVFGKVEIIKSLIALIAAYFLAMIVNNLCQSLAVDGGLWIWGAALAVAAIILINLLLDNLLRGRLQVNPWREHHKVKKFFAAYDYDAGARIFVLEKDYIICKPKKNQVVLAFMIPEIEFDQSKTGVAVKRLGKFEVGCRSLDASMIFSIWISFYNQYDVNEVADFVYDQFCSTGEATPYQNYLFKLVSDDCLTWMNDAEQEVYESYAKPCEELGIANENDYEEMWEKTGEAFLRIAQERFEPKLLSNVAGIEIRSVKEKEPVEVVETAEEKAKVPQNKKK